MEMLLLFSGPIAVGKSEIAKVLINNHQFRSLGSGAYLRNYANSRGLESNRAALQRLGDSLDDETDYRWIVDDIATPNIKAHPEQAFWLMDSVRKERQVRHFKDAFGINVLHTHFTAREDVLEKRYSERLSAGNEYGGNTPYSVAAKSQNEISSRGLREIADVILDLTKASPEEAAEAILKECNIRGKHASGSAD
jgi:cytidylate kinase